MRILLSTIGSRGDVQPLVALGLQLEALGHEPRFCVPPDFSDWVERLGFHVTPIGPAVRPTAAPGERPAQSVDRRRSAVEETVAIQFETIREAAEGCSGIVAATALQIGARSIAETMGIPYVFVSYCPVVLPSVHHAPPPLPPMPGQATETGTLDNRELWARDGARFNAVFGAPLNAHREALGLRPVEDVRSHIFTDRPWLAADAVLAPWPDASDRVFQTGAWMVSDDRALPPEINDFLARGSLPVHLGFGSMRAPEGLAEVMVAAARAAGRRALISSGWAGLALEEEGGDCLVVGEVNHQALFERVAAVVHHGGAGTTTTAARAGAPQVVVPQRYDQHYWAGRVRELGIGASHAAGAPTVDSLTKALKMALAPERAERARSLAAEVRTNGAGKAAGAIVAAFSA